jgi:hypothetical protein
MSFAFMIKGETVEELKTHLAEQAMPDDARAAVAVAVAALAPVLPTNELPLPMPGEEHKLTLRVSGHWAAAPGASFLNVQVDNV